MKRILSLILVFVLAFSCFSALVACGKDDGNSNDDTNNGNNENNGNNNGGTQTNVHVKGEGVMTYAEYAAAELDAAVVIEAFVQAKQGWWTNNETGVSQATIYLQDKDGAYFVYDLPISEADYNKLVLGQKVKISGVKAEWSGEVEIIDATYEILEGNWVATATDVTELLGKEELINYQNMFVSFKDLKVVASKNTAGEDVAYLYKWNGSGAEGDDLYFKVSDGKNTYTFTVESYLCGKDTDVYKAVKNLKIGQYVSLEGFLYWYDGVNPHITGVSGSTHNKGEGVMTYAEYAAAELDAAVVIEAFVQAKQGWWTDSATGVSQATIYLQDKDGAYFVYNLPISEAEYNKLVAGQKVKINGVKAEWSGEVEIIDATYEILEGNWVATVTDVTEFLGKEELINYQNMFVSFNTLTVVASQNTAGEDVAYLYKWNGSGTEGDDLYFKVSDGTNTYSFTVESYLCGKDTDVYKAVKALKIGQVIDLEGFLYWYDGVNPHITSVKTSVHNKGEGVMTYAEYAAAEIDANVVIEAFVQAKQGWWTDENGVSKASIYLQDKDGAYFAYDLPMSEAEYNKLVVGRKVKINGVKAEWSGEVEIIDATFVILEGYWVATATDVTELLGTDTLINYQNMFVSFKALTVAASKNAAGEDVAYLYKWNGSGAEGDDLYFKVTDGTNTYTFTVESYLCGKDTDVYKAVKALNVGDVIDLEGFLYWYDGVNPHITSVKVIPAN